MYGTSGIYEQVSLSIVSTIVKDMVVIVRTKLKNGGDWFSGTVKGLPSILTIEGKAFKLADISIKSSPDGKSSISIYYHTRHGKDLLRISDHWSERWRLIGSAIAVRGFKGGIKIG